jgi:hypothetical protein
VYVADSTADKLIFLKIVRINLSTLLHTLTLILFDKINSRQNAPWISGNAEFDADFGKVAENSCEKGYQRKFNTNSKSFLPIKFLSDFLHFFSGFELSIKCCVL